jgi:hypothetical protein
VPSSSQPGRYLQTRSHGSSTDKKPLQRLLGNEFYEYHTDVVIEGLQIPIEDLIAHLKNLRKLEYVFYTPNAGLTEAEIDSIECAFPNVNVVSAMKLGNK